MGKHAVSNPVPKASQFVIAINQDFNWSMYIGSLKMPGPFFIIDFGIPKVQHIHTYARIYASSAYICKFSSAYIVIRS